MRKDYLYRSKPTNEYKKNQEKKKVVTVTTTKAIIGSRKMDLAMLISLGERILENEIFTESQGISPQITNWLQRGKDTFTMGKSGRYTFAGDQV